MLDSALVMVIDLDPDESVVLGPLQSIPDGLSGQPRPIVEAAPIPAFTAFDELIDGEALAVILEAPGVPEDVQDDFQLPKGLDQGERIDELVREFAPVLGRWAESLEHGPSISKLW